MRKARYFCLEGTEGVGKTTQTQKLVDTLRAQGFKVLQTKEPGTNHIPLTMKLRELMLNNEYDAELTMPAREYLSQAIRSIHLEKLVVPALNEYDFIIQDRGILSGYSYGEACGNEFSFLKIMAEANVQSANISNRVFPYCPENIYDKVIYLRGNSKKNLERAKTSKQEYATGDAMESKGNTFIQKCSDNMDEYSSYFNACRIEVDDKSIEEVHQEILAALELKDA
jgi:dTMP kinase